jgi:hypothetical protein
VHRGCGCACACGGDGCRRTRDACPHHVGVVLHRDASLRQASVCRVRAGVLRWMQGLCRAMFLSFVVVERRPCHKTQPRMNIKAAAHEHQSCCTHTVLRRCTQQVRDPGGTKANTCMQTSSAEQHRPCRHSARSPHTLHTQDANTQLALKRHTQHGAHASTLMARGPISGPRKQSRRGLNCYTATPTSALACCACIALNACTTCTALSNASCTCTCTQTQGEATHCPRTAQQAAAHQVSVTAGRQQCPH